MEVKKLLSGHTDENSAYVVDDYPYGFHQRTKIRYWVESVKKKGDRFVSQTLNPKTGKWNKPKKSTYSAVVVMCLDEKDHVNWFNLYWSTDQEEYDRFVERSKGFEFNELQQNELKVIRAYIKTYKNVTFTCRARKYKHKITGEITEQIPFFEMGNYYEVDDEGNPVDKEAEEKREKETEEAIKKSVAYNFHTDKEV